jgi:hypothetical protein
VVESAGSKSPSTGITTHADFDLLLTAVFCIGDDLLPERRGNVRRRAADAEVVTLFVAQAVIGVGCRAA